MDGFPSNYQNREGDEGLFILRILSKEEVCANDGVGCPSVLRRISLDCFSNSVIYTSMT